MSVGAVRQTNRVKANVVVPGSLRGGISSNRSVTFLGAIQGHFKALKQTLMHAEIIGQNEHWIGGNRIVVQLGNVIGERNLVGEMAGSLGCYELLLKLREEAKCVGGQVVLICGNGEKELMESFHDQDYELSDLIKQSVLKGKVQMAWCDDHAVCVHGLIVGQLMNVLIKEITEEKQKKSQENIIHPADVVKLVNKLFVSAVQKCDFNHPIFYEGPLRGGKTPFPGVLRGDCHFDAVDRSNQIGTQIVGHSNIMEGNIDFWNGCVGCDSGATDRGNWAYVVKDPNGKMEAYRNPWGAEMEAYRNSLGAGWWTKETLPSILCRLNDIKLSASTNTVECNLADARKQCWSNDLYAWRDGIGEDNRANADKCFQEFMSIFLLCQKNMLNARGMKLSSLPNVFDLYTDILIVVRLDNNCLSCLPTSVRELKRVISMFLESNQFKKIPVELMEMSSLKHVDFSDNPLEEVSERFLEHPNLKFIGARETPFSKSNNGEPNAWVTLTKLASLPHLSSGDSTANTTAELPHPPPYDRTQRQGNVSIPSLPLRGRKVSLRRGDNSDHRASDPPTQPTPPPHASHLPVCDRTVSLRRGDNSNHNAFADIPLTSSHSSQSSTSSNS